MPYHVYIVRCTDESLYTGITTDLGRRIQQHNGELPGGARYTRTKRPVELVYVERYSTRSEASQREYHIKHELTRQQKEDLIRSEKNEMKK